MQGFKQQTSPVNEALAVLHTQQQQQQQQLLLLQQDESLSAMIAGSPHWKQSYSYGIILVLPFPCLHRMGA
jgi:hypothetical protein